MKFKLTNVAGADLGVIEINTIEELWNFRLKQGNPIIINTTWPDELPELEIYDGYRE